MELNIDENNQNLNCISCKAKQNLAIVCSSFGSNIWVCQCKECWDKEFDKQLEKILVLTLEYFYPYVHDKSSMDGQSIQDLDFTNENVMERFRFIEEYLRRCRIHIIKKMNEIGIE
jgi:hypothetical protein